MAGLWGVVWPGWPIVGERFGLFSTAIASTAIIPSMDAASVAVGSFLLLLTLVSVSVSINILLRGRIWRHLKPASRPRRWVLILLLVSLAVTLVWLPMFVERPHTAIAKVLTIVWGIVFLGTGLSLKLPFLSAAVDLMFERMGWPLR